MAVLIRATEAEIQDGCMGACRSCGVMASHGVEPDARGYDCEACGEPEVYGLEELLLEGELEIVDEE